MSKAIANYAVLSGKKAWSVDKAIEEAIVSLKTMRQRVQIAAVAVLMHAEKHGDYSKAQVLVEGLGNGINKASLQKWFVDFGGLAIDEESGNFSGWKGKEYIREQFENAKTTAWWEMKQAPAYKGFDLKAELGKVVERAEKALDKLNKIEKECGPDSEEFEQAQAKIDVDMELVRLINQARGGVKLIAA